MFSLFLRGDLLLRADFSIFFFSIFKPRSFSLIRCLSLSFPGAILKMCRFQLGTFCAVLLALLCHRFLIHCLEDFAFQSERTVGEMEHRRRFRWENCIDGCLFTLCPNLISADPTGKKRTRLDTTKILHCQNVECASCLHECYELGGVPFRHGQALDVVLGREYGGCFSTEKGEYSCAAPDAGPDGFQLCQTRQ